jgi:hypothetical protein
MVEAESELQVLSSKVLCPLVSCEGLISRIPFLFLEFSLMLIVRIFPKGEIGESWDRVLDNLVAISNERCTPLYLSKQAEKNFMSLIYDVKDFDFFGDILSKRIPSAVQPEKTRIVTLIRPVFFPAPKDRPANLERYQVAVRVRSEEMENVFNHILHLNYPKDAFPTYAAYSFGEDDILTSMLSTNRNRLMKFVMENLEPLKGVISVELGLIDRSKRVAPSEMWKKYRESKYVFEPTPEQEEYDFLEYAEKAKRAEKTIKTDYAEPSIETIANWIKVEENLANTYERLAAKTENSSWRVTLLQLAQDSRKSMNMISELLKSFEEIDREKAYRISLLSNPNP